LPGWHADRCNRHSATRPMRWPMSGPSSARGPLASVHGRDRAQGRAGERGDLERFAAIRADTSTQPSAGAGASARHLDPLRRGVIPHRQEHRHPQADVAVLLIEPSPHLAGGVVPRQQVENSIGNDLLQAASVEFRTDGERVQIQPELSLRILSGVGWRTPVRRALDDSATLRPARRWCAPRRRPT